MSISIPRASIKPKSNSQSWPLLGEQAKSTQRIPLGKRRWKHRKPDDLLFENWFSQQDLDVFHACLGSLAFEAQFQQNPQAVEGNLVKRDWINFYEEPPARDYGVRLIHSWDTASKTGQNNSYSVCTIWLQKGDCLYLLDVWRGRVEFPNLLAKAIQMKERDNPDVILIEDMASGQNLIQQLKSMNIACIPMKTEGNKVQRMEGATARMEAGGLWVPESAPWLDDFLAELLAFPAVAHDDQADTVSQVFEWTLQYPYEDYSNINFGGERRVSPWTRV